MNKCQSDWREMNLSVILFPSSSSLASLSLGLLTVQVDSSVNCLFIFLVLLPPTFKVVLFLLICRKFLCILDNNCCCNHLLSEDISVLSPEYPRNLRSFEVSIFPDLVHVLVYCFVLFFNISGLFTNNTV